MSGRFPPTDSSDEDEFAVSEDSNASSVGNRLGSLFAPVTKMTGNESLTYKAPKQPKDDDVPLDKGQKVSATDSEGTPVRVIRATAAHAFLLKDGQYVSQGKIGVAVLGNRAKHDYKILLYLSNKQPVGQATIAFTLTLDVNANNYVNFLDDRSASWSLAFDDENQMLTFLKYVFAVKALLFSDQHKEIVSLDIETGEGNQVDKGDSLEIEYTEFLIEDGPVVTEFSGSQNQKPFRVKLGKGEAPKGWVDGLLGMRKRGKRLFIVPPSLGYSGHNTSATFPTNTPLMVYAVVKRVKFEKRRDESPPKAISHERELSTDSSISGSIAEGVSDNTPDVITKENDSTKEKDSADSDVHKKADIISRMARIGHAVIGASPVGPGVRHIGQESGVALPSATHGKPELPIKPSTVPNPLAVVCADVTVARPAPTSTVAKSSSAGSIVPSNFTSASPASSSIAGLPNPVLPHPQFDLANMISIPHPSMAPSGSTVPFMFPFAYPPHSYFLQPPFMAPSCPPTSSDLSSMASSSSLSPERQMIVDEIQKCHLWLQDALTKTFSTYSNAVLTKLSEVDANLNQLRSRPNGDGVLSEKTTPTHPEPISGDSFRAILSKLDQFDAMLRPIAQSCQDQEPRSQVMRPHKMDTLAEKLSSLQESVDGLKMTCATLASGNEWKEKYDKLKSQALAMKENYEDRIRKLEGQLQDNSSSIGLSESDKIKKIISTFYKNASQRFAPDEQFEGGVVREIILDVVKESTLLVLTEPTSPDVGDPKVPECGQPKVEEETSVPRHDEGGQTNTSDVASSVPVANEEEKLAEVAQECNEPIE